MTLRQFEAQAKRQIYEDLVASREPHIGEYSADELVAAQKLGNPQMGKSRFEPSCIKFEYIFSHQGESQILVVQLNAPERIVYMPIPDWVTINVWHGEVSGGHFFVSESGAMMAELLNQLEPGPNAALFAPRAPIRRE